MFLAACCQSEPLRPQTLMIAGGGGQLSFAFLLLFFSFLFLSSLFGSEGLVERVHVWEEEGRMEEEKGGNPQESHMHHIILPSFLFRRRLQDI